MTTPPWHAVVYIVRNVFYKAEPNAIRLMLKERAVQVSNKVVWISYIPGYGAALIRWKWVVLPAPWPGQVHPAMTLGLTATS